MYNESFKQEFNVSGLTKVMGQTANYGFEKHKQNQPGCVNDLKMIRRL